MNEAKESLVIIGEDGSITFKPEFLRDKQIKEAINVATGRGIVDWKAVRAEADAQGEVHYFIERVVNYDPALDQLACIVNDICWEKAYM